MTTERGTHIDSLMLDISVGQKNQGEVQNKRTSWADLRKKLSLPAVGNETMAEYLRMAVSEQLRLKNVGFFIACHCEDGKRRAMNIKKRSAVTFDVDNCTPALLDEIEMGLTELSVFEFYVYSTRKHTKEAPRVRVVIPLKKPCNAGQYHALSRILAQKLDITMDSIDDVTFRVAQMMYYPSHCRGADFYTYHNKGSLCDADAVLEAFGDWQDFSKLPFSAKHGHKRLSDPTIKAEVPTEKRGVVGAFCRQFNVPEVIEQFLLTTYKVGDEHSSKPRYTYAHGTSANGAVVEDDGLFLYSYHTTDPCADRLVNSWDLVRIHKFGDLDEPGDEDKGKPGDLKSFKAMTEFAQSQPAVREELAKAQYDTMAMFDDLPEDAFDEQAVTDDIDDLIGGTVEKVVREVNIDWFKELDITDDGKIKANVSNLALILQHDPRLKGRVQFNEFTQETVTRKPVRSKLSYMLNLPPRDTKNGDMWQDIHETNVRVLLESPKGKDKPGFGMKVTDRDLSGAVDLAAMKQPFHPVREFFESVKWDGKPRIDTMLIDYLGVEDNEYFRQASRLTFLAGTTRVYEPGHKYDYMLIIEGLQGAGKSTFFEILGCGWFAELKCRLDDVNRLIETFRGALVVEVPELSQFGAADVEIIKAFVTTRADKSRLAFERRARDFARQCIFAGTSNGNGYLRDRSGNRRFLPCPLKVHAIDLVQFRANVGQMWAEAAARYKAMRAVQPTGQLPLMLQGDDALNFAKDMQASRVGETEQDGLAGMIGAWLDKPIGETRRDGSAVDMFDDEDDLIGGSTQTIYRDEVCLMEIWVDCFHSTSDKYKRTEQLSLSRAMQQVDGWEKGRLAHLPKWGRQMVYRRKK